MRKLTIGKRIILGFSVVLSLLAFLVAYSIYGISDIVTNAEEVIDGNKLRGEIIQREVDHLNWAMALNKLVTDSHTHAFNYGLDPKECKFGKWYYGEGRRDAEKLIPELKPVLKEIEEHHNKLHHSAKSILSKYRKADERLPAFFAQKEADHFKWALSLISAIYQNNKSLHIETGHKKCSFGKSLYGKLAKSLAESDPKYKEMFRSITKPHELLHQSASRINSLLKESKFNQAKDYYNKHTVRYLKETSSRLNQMINYATGNVNGLSNAKAIYTNTTLPSLQKVQSSLGSVVKLANENVMTDKQMLSAASATKAVDLIIGVISVILGVLLSIVITRSICRPLSRISSHIGDSSMQVTAASEQLSSASQEIAEMSSSQASSIEQTSASIEELTGMVKSNEGSASEAEELSVKVSSVVSDGNVAISELVDSMKSILESNNKIHELVSYIKTIGEKTAVIDEIVFQTKLLSFNASVEAERAGEHGRGFAVVAQEVGNLAQMSGKAALEISSIVQEGAGSAEQISSENRIRVDRGNELVERAASILEEIKVHSNQVCETSQQILTSSREQTTGISQINSAVVDLDKAVQHNASTSEQTASASEELSAQAISLSSVVDELVLMISGDAKNRRSS